MTRKLNRQQQTVPKVELKRKVGYADEDHDVARARKAVAALNLGMET
jgi:hypothetical protein